MKLGGNTAGGVVASEHLCGNGAETIQGVETELGDHTAGSVGARDGGRFESGAQED